ncbi:hypothetical protein [Streptomyces cyaneofuscatus]|uniref:hypothetical protein n=1 Tax=Streptomyces cyaneofuscatus TaxID=66883 RepID=UPI0037A9116C
MLRALPPALVLATLGPLLAVETWAAVGVPLQKLREAGARLRPAIEEAMAGEKPAAEIPHRVLSAVFGVLEEQRGAWFVLYDRTLKPGTDLHAAAHRHRRTIDDLAASGTADLLRGHGNEDPLDADALKHVRTGTVGALVGWWAPPGPVGAGHGGALRPAADRDPGLSRYAVGPRRVGRGPT